MHGFLANTDIEWFTFLRSLGPLEEVNFWQPSAHGFNATPGTPFFFKLKKPHYKVGGFGIFARYEAASPKLAWEAFGKCNGAPTFEAMLRRVGRYTAGSGGPAHKIGCIMVSEPVFFSEEAWIDQPRDWPSNVVSRKGYDLTSGEGRRVWEECLERVALIGPTITSMMASEPPPPRYGEPQLVRPRLGQGTFRLAVTGAYDGRCAVSHERSLPVLEAAHIRPFSDEGPQEVSNGLLLRADIHKLFDAGYVTVTPEHRFVVSRRLEEQWENGKIYYAMEDRSILLPQNKEDRPSLELLRWHNENVFERSAA